MPTAEEPWAVITDEIPSLQSFVHYGKRFDTEELYLDSKSGAFELEDSRLDEAEHLERLYRAYLRVVGGFNLRLVNEGKE